mmetsp:Transcript_40311/g.88138  ORF Transcript_40311/g.88138 Transcript_40311/m.88138 type:complete len:201 (-) Transcript_40311:323-925(-)
MRYLPQVKSHGVEGVLNPSSEQGSNAASSPSIPTVVVALLQDCFRSHQNANVEVTAALALRVGGRIELRDATHQDSLQVVKGCFPIDRAPEATLEQLFHDLKLPLLRNTLHQDLAGRGLNLNELSDVRPLEGGPRHIQLAKRASETPNDIAWQHDVALQSAPLLDLLGKCKPLQLKLVGITHDFVAEFKLAPVDPDFCRV